MRSSNSPNNSFKEAFLHYVWQYQYFDKVHLCTTKGESLSVFSPGFSHHHAGPDFRQARILLEGVEWHGHVEIHYFSSDWNMHHHERDRAYNNVILHVVWENDLLVQREDGTLLPTLVLKGRIDPQLISHFHQLVKTEKPIPCAPFVPVGRVDQFVVLSMLERCLIERLEEKCQLIFLLYQNTQNDWEETAYRWLGKCFGFKVNSEAFLKLCEYVPYRLIQKYKSNKFQLEALLYGCGGFLEAEFRDEYPEQLQKEFRYLAAKHQLNAQMHQSEWKFLRLRPANFPTIRISQFASFLFHLGSLYDRLFQMKEISDWDNVLSCPSHPYWLSHFVFDEPSSSTKPQSHLGKKSRDNLIVNAFLPLQFSYAELFGLEDLKVAIIDLFHQVKAEDNSLLSQYDFLPITIVDAFQAQAIHQLYHGYCSLKRCLSCQIGHQLLHV